MKEVSSAEQRSYQRCTRCIMDTTDTTITFDEAGVCNHCRNFDQVLSKGYFPNEVGSKKLNDNLNLIKNEGKDKEYDCIIGLSGGVDSCYLALKVKEWGLRPLVVHVDTGWNSELAVANINKIIDYCGYELFTHVINWDEMRDLQVAFLKSGVANQDVPQDHAIFASVYHFAVKHKIKYILTGGNIATEGIFPQSWQGNAMDAINLKAIHKAFGKKPLLTYPTISLFEYYFFYPFVKKMRTVRLLNFINYNKKSAIQEMEAKIGWRNYGRKHGESIFTKLFQNYYQPTKFGYDKRLPHLSSLIVTGQVSRDEALKALGEPLYASDELENDIAYFCRKLDVTREEFDRFISDTPHHYTDFPNSDSRIALIRKLQKFLERIYNKRLTVYS
nr:N-acetyl sugar amidotransferase [uncultured Sediminibacterium sp.]